MEKKDPKQEIQKLIYTHPQTTLHRWILTCFHGLKIIPVAATLKPISCCSFKVLCLRCFCSAIPFSGCLLFHLMNVWFELKKKQHGARSNTPPPRGSAHQKNCIWAGSFRKKKISSVPCAHLCYNLCCSGKKHPRWSTGHTRNGWAEPGNSGTNHSRWWESKRWGQKRSAMGVLLGGLPGGFQLGVPRHVPATGLLILGDTWRLGSSTTNLPAATSRKRPPEVQLCSGAHLLPAGPARGCSWDGELRSRSAAALPGRPGLPAVPGQCGHCNPGAPKGASRAAPAAASPPAQREPTLPEFPACWPGGGRGCQPCWGGSGLPPALPSLQAAEPCLCCRARRWGCWCPPGSQASLPAGCLVRQRPRGWRIRDRVFGETPRWSPPSGRSPQPGRSSVCTEGWICRRSRAPAWQLEHLFWAGLWRSASPSRCCRNRGKKTCSWKKKASVFLQ